MPKDARPPRAGIVQDTLRALWSYTEPYHLNYPRLLAEGLSKAKIAERLVRHEDIVEMHVDLFYDRVPELRRHPEKAAIITEALCAFDQGQRPESILKPPGTGVPAPVASTPDPPAPVPPPSSGVVFVPPPDDEMVERINGLPRAGRRLLVFLSQRDSVPDLETAAGLLNVTGDSMRAMVSTLYSGLGFKRPPGIERSDWSRLRHDHLRRVASLPGITPIPERQA